MKMLSYGDIDKIVSTTHDTVNKLLTYKNGPDALALYFRYIQQQKMQQNSNTHSSTRFMKKATGRGQDRFLKAKSILLECGMIEEVIKKNSEGTIEGWYVKVKYVIHSVPETDTGVPDMGTVGVPESPLVVKQVQNTLVENTNTLVENKKDNMSKNSSTHTQSVIADEDKKPTYTNKGERFEEFWKSFPHTSGRSSKKDSLDSYRRSEYTEDEIIFEKDLLLLKLKYEIIEIGYIPASERRIKKLTKTQGVVLEKIIKQIVYAHMKNPQKIREDVELLISVFGKEKIMQYNKEYNKEFNSITFNLT